MTKAEIRMTKRRQAAVRPQRGPKGTGTRRIFAALRRGRGRKRGVFCACGSAFRVPGSALGSGVAGNRKTEISIGFPEFRPNSAILIQYDGRRSLQSFTHSAMAFCLSPLCLATSHQ